MSYRSSRGRHRKAHASPLALGRASIVGGAAAASLVAAGVSGAATIGQQQVTQAAPVLKPADD